MHSANAVSAARRAHRALAACAQRVRIANPAAHTMSAPPTLTPELRFTDARRLHMCRARALQAHDGARARALRWRCRERCEPRRRLIRPRVPLAMRTQASSTPARRPTYPNSHAPRLDSRASPQAQCTCPTTSCWAAERPDGLYDRPDERPQASRPLSRRCGLAVGSRSTSPSSPHCGPQRVDAGEAQ